MSMLHKCSETSWTYGSPKNSLRLAGSAPFEIISKQLLYTFHKARISTSWGKNDRLNLRLIISQIFDQISRFDTLRATKLSIYLQFLQDLRFQSNLSFLPHEVASLAL